MLPKVKETNVPVKDNEDTAGLQEIIESSQFAQKVTIAYLLWTQKGKRTDEYTMNALSYSLAREAPKELRVFRLSFEPFGVHFIYKDNERPFRIVVDSADDNGALIRVEQQNGSMTRADVEIDKESTGPDFDLPDGVFVAPAGHA